jgi:hypothetical protein
MTKFKLKLLIRKMYLHVYVKFEFNVYNHCKDKKRKLKISDSLQSSRGITHIIKS